jgi:MFS family permease
MIAPGLDCGVSRREGRASIVAAEGRVAEEARIASDGADAAREDGTAWRGSSRVRLPVALAPLRHRNYRLLWIGTLISQSGDWMDQIALNWLVYQLTGSAFALGLVNLCRLAPILLFTLVGGVIADRVERRKLMFTTQTVAMVLALVLAVLVSTGLVELWMVLLVAVGRGIALSFNLPARQSLISDLVPREVLSSAIALNQATNNLTRVLGPIVGGLLIATIGVAGAFYVNGFSFLAVLYGLALMRFPPRAVRQKKGILTELVGGLGYIRGEPNIRTLVMLALVPMILGQPYMTMLTVFASDVLQVGGSGLGMLMACSGAGAVCGALFIASRGAKRGRRRLMRIGLIAYGVTLLVFSLSPWFWLSAGTLLAVGFSQQVYNAQNNALVQDEVDPEYRGRVVSTLFLNRGLVPLGTVFAGFGTDLWGVQATLGMMAVLLVLLAVFVTGRRLVATAASPAA